MMSQKSVPSLLSLMAIGMDMCCVIALLLMLRRHLGLSDPSCFILLISYPFLFLLSLITSRRPALTGNRTYTSALGVTLASSVAIIAVRNITDTADQGIQSEDIVIIGLLLGLCGLFMWLGNTLNSHLRRYQTLCCRFQVNLLVLMVLTIIDRQVFVLVVFFFLLASLSLALSRWKESTTETLGILRPVRPWLFALGTAGVLFISLGVFLTLSPEMARSVVTGLKTWAGALIHLLDVNPIPQASGKQITFGLSGCSLRPAQREQFLSPARPRFGENTAPTDPVILWIIVFGVFVATLAFVFVCIRKMKARQVSGTAMVSTGEASTIPFSILSWYLAFFNKLYQKWLLLLLKIRTSLSAGRFITYDTSIILPTVLYRKLLRWGERHGISRTHAQTPLEYLMSLCVRFPEHKKAFTVITDVFIHARYNQTPPPDEAVAAAGAEWHTITKRKKRS